MFDQLLKATYETIAMVTVSSIFATLLGLPIGLILFATKKDSIAENKIVYRILDVVINILRSMPFVILMIVVFPLAKLIVGKKIGMVAAMVPLSVSAAPFVARVMENCFSEIDKGKIEAAKSMGAGKFDILKLVLKESTPGVIDGITMTVINLIGYSAMAGALGGGGLGDIAIRYGWNMNKTDMLMASVVIIVVIVQVIQFVGTRVSRKINKR
ncbi:MAG: methionine ABC transporter permease [Ezakiella sp.]|nr:ABC transporter permease [Ezakiella sp.]MDD7761286.1 ABC transporter permease [Bacillota bacterium]MDY3947167.1 methionine ABC transporter permease [Ezakiella sp.]